MRGIIVFLPMFAFVCMLPARAETTGPMAGGMPTSPAARERAEAPSETALSPLTSLATLKDYRSARVASFKPDSNDDSLHPAAHETTTIAQLEGPGEITHLWTTIATDDPNHLRNIVLRIYWDGNSFPSVEAPIGDFYGLGHAKYYYFSNPVQAIGTNQGMNCFWPMPFAKSARVEITNESDTPIGAFYYYVDWRKLDRMPEKSGYFHAQYRQAFPNESGKPYLIMEADGAQGHYAGVSLSIHTQTGGWWGEGDDIISIDGESPPSIWGTGSEDYFCGAWCYGDAFFTPYFGMPLRTRPDHGVNNYWNVYRLHLESPIAFTRSIRVDMEHGAAGFDETREGGNNDYSSVAYWYQGVPRPLKGKLPPAEQRISVMVPPKEFTAGTFEPQYMDASLPNGTHTDQQDMRVSSTDGRKWVHDDQLMFSGKEGSAAEFAFETTGPLQGPSVLRLAKAPDYGMIQVRLDGRVLVKSFDAYAPEVVPYLIRLSEQKLEPGKHKLSVQTIGKNGKSSGYRWAIDYLRVGGRPPEAEAQLGAPPTERQRPRD